MLLGDAGVIDDLRESWRACTHERDHCDEWRFAAWAVANGVAVLPNVETPTDGTLPVYWYLRHIVGVVGRVHAVFPHP